VAHTCNPSYSGGRNKEDHGSKTLKKERAGGVSQVAEHLPTKHEALSSL
jgi:hypothetical protein